MRQNKPSESKREKAKAKSYGYKKGPADQIGMGQKKAEQGRQPVAKDTNKTRRKMNDPGKKGKLG